MTEIEMQRFATDFPLLAPLFKGEPDGLRRHFNQWKKFHQANPRVWDLFQMFAQHAIDAGYSRYSADAILHRIRWHVTVEVKSYDDFRINNNFSAYYSRLFAHAYPAHAAFFETRKLAIGDEAWLSAEMIEIAHSSVLP